MKRVLITGGGGQLARALVARLGGPPAVWAPARAELDITDPAALREACGAHRPAWIINCAAFTAVDAAEADPATARRINADGVRHVADAALSAGARLIHISTDYVFDGLKAGAYVEDDAPHPINAYGASKLAGEEALAAHSVRSAVLRTAWLYGEAGRSFLARIIERGRRAAAAGEDLPVVADQVGSPTDVHTLAGQIETAMREGITGLYHAAAAGAASWFELAEKIFAGLGLAPRLVPIPGATLGRLAPRPPRVVLENRNLQALGLDQMIPWQEGLRGVLARLRAGAAG